jgi:hypothetical protein
MGLGNEDRGLPRNVFNNLLIWRKCEWQWWTSTGVFLDIMRIFLSNGKRCSVGKSAVFQSLVLFLWVSSLSQQSRGW